jgi:hypothetical protein
MDMIMGQIKEKKLSEICSKLLDDGKYHEALTQIAGISNKYIRAGFLIDAGLALGNRSRVQEGTEIIEQFLSGQHFIHNNVKSTLLYNAANGHSYLYELMKKRRKTAVPANDDDLKRAKHLYRQALETPPITGRKSFYSQVWVNYGNCLSQLGRYIEAAECYQKALELDPINGMASGNLGIELFHAARITGKYRHEYISLAHVNLVNALSPSMHLKFGSMQAIQQFRAIRDNLQNILDAHKKPLLPPKPVRTPAGNNLFKQYIRFCINNGLFLNAWVGDKNLTPGVVDDISFSPITTSVGDKYLVPELLNILNEIKEAFATARYLFFLSQHEKQDLASISRFTYYFGVDTTATTNGLYAGLCKTAYSRAFDILDKVARIVNVYFNIGKREDTFWNIFAVKRSRGEGHLIDYIAKLSISERGNSCLFALVDLCIDYFEDKDVELRTINYRRNRITHDYLLVKSNDRSQPLLGDGITFENLSSQTMKVLHLAKNAILYAVSAIAIEEARKDNSKRKKLNIKYSSTTG